ncbi:MAG: transglutaminase domain-containing protein [Dehalococcoidia bacterium]
MSASVDITGRYRRVLQRRGAAGADSRFMDLRPVSWLRSVPLEEWVTLGLLGIMLAIVAWSVQLADWGDLPSILPTVLMGWATAFLLHRLRVSWPLMLAGAVSAGFLVVMWQGSLVADGGNSLARATDAWHRTYLWIEAARTGGISTDTVPFALMFMTVSWLAAFSVTGITMKTRNPWAPTLLLGVGILTNLSYRQGQFEHTFFYFVLIAVVMFAHLTTVRRMSRWRTEGTSYPVSLRWLSIRDGLLVGAVVVILSAMMPLYEVRSETLGEAWRTMRQPIDALRAPAERLLSGVRGSGRQVSLTAPGTALAFKGPISLSDEPVMWVTSKYPVMHPARVYQTYTSQGWLVAPRSTSRAPAREALIPAPDDLAREEITQTIEPLANTTTVLPVGGAFSLDREALVETLTPLTYSVPLTAEPISPQSLRLLSSMPPDLQEFAFNTRTAALEMYSERSIRVVPLSRPDGPSFQATSDFRPVLSRADVEEITSGIIPDGAIVTIDVDPSTGQATSMTVQREEPAEQVGAAFIENVPAADRYQVTTHVSVAEEEDLAAAGQDYPAWVTDRYLQLPSSLPRQVRRLAHRVVVEAQAVTPHERVQAIAEFLQSQEYSQEISGPAPDTDGVYYFLFQTQQEPCPSVNPDCDVDKIKGYSQYYGSAGTVMLRSVGVPARMVAGWATGAYVPNAGKFVVRDRDLHGWLQVYYPGYGWIDTEVTPGRSQPDSNDAVSVQPGDIPFQPSDLGEGEEAYLNNLDQQDIEEAERLAREALRGIGGVGDGSGDDSSNIPEVLLASLAAMAGSIVLLFGYWKWSFRGMGPAASAYTKMERAGRLLGLKRQNYETAMEYAAVVSAAAPESTQHAMMIAIEYERMVYGHRNGSDEQPKDLKTAWRSVLRGMLGYRLRRLTRNGSNGNLKAAASGRTNGLL